MLSPLLFNIVLEALIREISQKKERKKKASSLGKGKNKTLLIEDKILINAQKLLELINKFFLQDIR